MKQSKTILIIGGMGPIASCYAHRLILERYASLGAKDNDQYPTIVHLSINVKDFINGNEADADVGFEYIKQKLPAIDMKKIDVGFIACNTAHILFSKINNLCAGKLIPIIDVGRYIVVCSKFTAKNHLYNIKGLIFPSQSNIERLDTVIRNVIANNIDSETISVFKNIIQDLINQGCKQIVIGCSELSILADMIEQDYADGIFVDPIDIVIERIVCE
jgi:aspartate/glutamate racemase